MQCLERVSNSIKQFIDMIQQKVKLMVKTLQNKMQSAIIQQEKTNIKSEILTKEVNIYVERNQDQLDELQGYIKMYMDTLM